MSDDTSSVASESSIYDLNTSRTGESSEASISAEQQTSRIRRIGWGDTSPIKPSGSVVSELESPPTTARTVDSEPDRLFLYFNSDINRAIQAHNQEDGELYYLLGVKTKNWKLDQADDYEVCYLSETPYTGIKEWLPIHMTNYTCEHLFAIDELLAKHKSTKKSVKSPTTATQILEEFMNFVLDKLFRPFSKRGSAEESQMEPPTDIDDPLKLDDYLVLHGWMALFGGSLNVDVDKTIQPKFADKQKVFQRGNGLSEADNDTKTDFKIQFAIVFNLLIDFFNGTIHRCFYDETRILNVESEKSVVPKIDNTVDVANTKWFDSIKTKFYSGTAGTNPKNIVATRIHKLRPSAKSSESKATTNANQKTTDFGPFVMEGDDSTVGSFTHSSTKKNLNNNKRKGGGNGFYTVEFCEDKERIKLEESLIPFKLTFPPDRSEDDPGKLFVLAYPVELLANGKIGPDPKNFKVVKMLKNGYQAKSKEAEPAAEGIAGENNNTKFLDKPVEKAVSDVLSKRNKQTEEDAAAAKAKTEEEKKKLETEIKTAFAYMNLFDPITNASLDHPPYLLEEIGKFAYALLWFLHVKTISYPDPNNDKSIKTEQNPNIKIGKETISYINSLSTEHLKYNELLKILNLAQNFKNELSNVKPELLLLVKYALRQLFADLLYVANIKFQNASKTTITEITFAQPATIMNPLSFALLLRNETLDNFKQRVSLLLLSDDQNTLIGEFITELTTMIKTNAPKTGGSSKIPHTKSNRSRAKCNKTIRQRGKK